MTIGVARSQGFTVRLFMPAGDPDGVKLIEKSNWTGAGLVIPRARFALTRQRAELLRAGVYILVGPDESSQLPKVDVGEGDPVGPRLDQHARAKDFWTHVVTFTSKDQYLNKAHVQFLEARLIGLAKVANRCNLDNLNMPQIPSLSEPDTADVDGFLADVLLCLAVLGYAFFEPPPSPKPVVHELRLSGRGIVARGYEASGGFVVS